MRGQYKCTWIHPQITIFKINNDDKSDKNRVEIKLRMDPMSQNTDLYELKMALFDNSEPEEFLLFIVNFNMTI